MRSKSRKPPKHPLPGSPSAYCSISANAHINLRYILGQLNLTTDSTANSTLKKNSTDLNARHARRHSHHKHHQSPNLVVRQATDGGPIQCGAGLPCKDGAGCSRLGKYDFKEAHCSPANCLSNCDAKAMCGIDSPEGTTKCGLKLCCSFYGL
jgi:chitinase